jgi:hypothetical protein
MIKEDRIIGGTPSSGRPCPTYESVIPALQKFSRGATFDGRKSPIKEG